jgi:hypothetical protein
MIIQIIQVFLGQKVISKKSDDISLVCVPTENVAIAGPGSKVKAVCL